MVNVKIYFTAISAEIIYSLFSKWIAPCEKLTPQPRCVSPSFWRHSPFKPLYVTAKLTNVGLGQNTTPGFAGEILWTQAPLNNAAWVNNSFTSFCIEINQHVNLGGTYTFETKALENAPVSPSTPMGITGKADQIRRMWSYAHADPLRLHDPVNAAKENAAFQQAIWKILDSNFTVDNSLSLYVSTFIAQSNNSSNAKANLIALTNPGVQDQIVELNSGYYPSGNDVIAAPAPAGFILFLTGVVPMMAFRRFRKSVI